MFKLSSAGEKWVSEFGISDGSSCGAIAISVISYAVGVGFRTTSGAIGQLVLSKFDQVEINYQSAVQSAALGAIIWVPASYLLSRAVCGGDDRDLSNSSGWIDFYNNFLAASYKASCFVPGTFAYTIALPIKAAAFGAVNMLIGSAISGNLVSTQSIAESAAIGACGSAIFAGGWALMFFIYFTVENGLDCCTPTVTVNYSRCECPISLPAWQRFRSDTQNVPVAKTIAQLPLVIEALPVDQASEQDKASYNKLSMANV